MFVLFLSTESKAEGKTEPAADPGPQKKKRVMGPSRVTPPPQPHTPHTSDLTCVSKTVSNNLFLVSPQPPVQLSGQYPEDDPDYSVWVPPAGKQLSY